MTTDNKGLSRRKLLKAGAIGVPAAGVLAFGSTLVTATSANAISTDGWWGSETSLGLQKFMNAIMTGTWNDEFGSMSKIPTVADGVISSQPSSMAPACPGIVGGWEWVEVNQAKGSPTIQATDAWLKHLPYNYKNLFGTITTAWIEYLQKHYGIPVDRRLDAPSRTIQALQNEINQYV